jgi:hypothetical protein
VASSGRVVTCAHESAGKRAGTSGHTIGHVHLTWAFSAAAVLCLVDHPPGQHYERRLEHKEGSGQAVTVFAPQLARAVDARFKRHTRGAMAPCMPGEGRGVGEPAEVAGDHRHGRRAGGEPGVREPWAWCGRSRRLLVRPARDHRVRVGCPVPEPDIDGRTRNVPPGSGRGRDAGTKECLGRSRPQIALLPWRPPQPSTLDTCLVQRRGWHRHRARKPAHVTVGGPCQRGSPEKSTLRRSGDYFAS